MGQSQKAQQVYEVLLDQPKNESDKAHIYVQLGRAKNDQEKYDKAITFYEKSLEIHKRTHVPNHPDMGISYNNIGLVYYNVGEYSKALSFQEKALEIRQQSLSLNHPDFGHSCENIGTVYENMGDYTKVLSFYEHAVEIGRRSLPSNNRNLQKWRKSRNRVKKRSCNFYLCCRKIEMFQLKIRSSINHEF